MTFTDQNSVILLKMTVLSRRSGTLPVPGVASKQQTYHVKTHHTNLDKPFKVLVLMSLCQLLMHTVPMSEIVTKNYARNQRWFLETEIHQDLNFSS